MRAEPVLLAGVRTPRAVLYPDVLTGAITMRKTAAARRRRERRTRRPRRQALKIAIIQAGKSQRRVAASSRIPEARMSDIACGRTDPTDPEMERIARTLHRPVIDLFPDLFPEGPLPPTATGAAAVPEPETGAPDPALATV